MLSTWQRELSTEILTWMKKKERLQFFFPLLNDRTLLDRFETYCHVVKQMQGARISNCGYGSNSVGKTLKTTWYPFAAPISLPRDDQTFLILQIGSPFNAIPVSEKSDNRQMRITNRRWKWLLLCCRPWIDKLSMQIFLQMYPTKWVYFYIPSFLHDGPVWNLSVRSWFPIQVSSRAA